MAKFLIRRIGQGIVVLWLITMAVFGLFFVAPNNVARTLAGRQATPAHHRPRLAPTRAGPAHLEAVRQLHLAGPAR